MIDGPRVSRFRSLRKRLRKRSSQRAASGARSGFRRKLCLPESLEQRTPPGSLLFAALGGTALGSTAASLGDPNSLLQDVAATSARSRDQHERLARIRPHEISSSRLGDSGARDGIEWPPGSTYLPPLSPGEPGTPPPVTANRQDYAFSFDAGLFSPQLLSDDLTHEAEASAPPTHGPSRPPALPPGSAGTSDSQLGSPDMAV